MSALLLDTHVVHWWFSEPGRLSKAATTAILGADDLAVAAITWYELAWLAIHNRITTTISVDAWLDQLARRLLTFNLTPATASIAVSLPNTFPGDPADRLIYATAIDNGVRLVTKDRRLRGHPHPHPVTVW
ncbi:MAG: type II toxin-antitoxin system VapC family toxin [Actinomycetota bacterium]